MKATFSAVAGAGKLRFTNTEDLYKYCIENEGEDIFVELKPIGKTSEKMRMYAFLFGPLMHCAVRAYTEAGWAGIDKTKARYMLQAEFSKEDLYNHKLHKVQTIYEDIGHMTRARLLKFIVDVCFYLENEFGMEIPDSVAWKIKLDTGKEYKQVI